MRIHCIGVAGSGMLPLAVYLRTRGHTVSGSDRFMDQAVGPEKFSLLRSHGITLHPQDGSAVTPAVDQVIYSGAVEATVPDLARARELNIPCLSRAQALAGIFNAARGVAIAGSSGKSTTAAMAGFILNEAGLKPALISGAPLMNYVDRPERGAFLAGESDLLVIEADESDGTVTGYRPAIGVVLNISLDHMEIPVLKELFGRFAANSRSVIYNRDCPHVMDSPVPRAPDAMAFGTTPGLAWSMTDVAAGPEGVTWRLNGIPFRITLPGAHNAENATAAAAAAELVGLPLAESARILARFRGVERRMHLVGVRGGVIVLDDYAHNPAKVRAAIATARTMGRRIVAVFQPHGFGPTKFIRTELVTAFSEAMDPSDRLFIIDIFYAGGTADKSISSADIAAEVAARGIAAAQVTRADAAQAAAAAARPGDVVLVMGARDITLADLAKAIHAALPL
ncbi:MAG: Mur ligase domain-containing protein [Planctomycetota bacterium]